MMDDSKVEALRTVIIWEDTSIGSVEKVLEITESIVLIDDSTEVHNCLI